MSKQPNLVVFFTDQQRPDSIGCYGQPLETTPNLDRLAARGVQFLRAFSPNPVCGPARASLQTGLYPAATGSGGRADLSGSQPTGDASAAALDGSDIDVLDG